MRTVARGAAAVAALVLGVGAWTPYAAASFSSAEPVDLGGQPIDGSTNPTEPTEIEAGLWLDSLGPTTASGTHHFVYERTMDESTVHVGVVATSPEASSDGISLAVLAGEDDCGSDSQSSTSYTQHGVFGAIVSVGPDAPGTDDGVCLMARTLTITVSRDAAGTADLPFAIKVVEEAPVTGIDPDAPDLPQPDEETTYQLPASGDAEALDGGTSFDEATALDPVAEGVTVTTDIAEGDERLYRVPATWGQQVVAVARIPRHEDEAFYGPTVDVRIVDPMRNTMDYYATDRANSGSYGTDALTLSVAGQPLRYLNRWDGLAPVLPGDFWVAVAVQPAPVDGGREPVSVPVELTVAVPGEAGEGAPTHQETVIGPGGGAAPEGYSSDTPYLVGDGEFAAVASGNPFTPDTEDDAWWGPRRGVGIGVGVVSLACCAVGAVWLSRRRAR